MILKFLPILGIVAIILLCGVNTDLVSANDSLNELKKTAITESEDTNEAVFNIERLLQLLGAGEKDKRLELLRELKNDLEIIRERKNDLDKYTQINDVSKVENITNEIIKKSNKIYAYDCMFDLFLIKEELEVNFWRLSLRGKDVYDINKGIEDANSLLSFEYPYRIQIGFEDFKSNCSSIKNQLITLNSDAIKELSNPFDIGTLGATFITLTISYIIGVPTFILLRKKEYKLKEKPARLLVYLITIPLALFWLFYFFGINPNPQRINSLPGIIFISFIAGVFIGHLYISIINMLKPLLSKGYKEPKKKTRPLKELKELNEDYTELLETEGIKSLDDLVEKEDIKALSESTHISIEKIIEFRQKAKRIIGFKRTNKSN